MLLYTGKIIFWETGVAVVNTTFDCTYDQSNTVYKIRVSPSIFKKNILEEIFKIWFLFLFW